jgi:hypothetical protein
MFQMCFFVPLDETHLKHSPCFSHSPLLVSIESEGHGDGSDMQQKSAGLGHKACPPLFVSHASEDARLASRLVKKLETFGVRSWIASRDVRPGGPFDKQIFDAIMNSRAVLLIFSERVNASPWVHREIAVASDMGKLIIPLRIENAHPKGGLALRLASLHQIDGFDGGNKAVHDVLHTLGRSHGRRLRQRRPRRS